MKNLILLTLIILSFVACNDEEQFQEITIIGTWISTDESTSSISDGITITLTEDKFINHNFNVEAYYYIEDDMIYTGYEEDQSNHVYSYTIDSLSENKLSLYQNVHDFYIICDRVN